MGGMKKAGEQKNQKAMLKRTYDSGKIKGNTGK